MSSSGSRTQLVPAIPSRVPSVAQLDAAARKAAAEEARAFARYAGTPAVAAAEAQEAALHDVRRTGGVLQGVSLFAYRSDIPTIADPDQMRAGYTPFLSIGEILKATDCDDRLTGLRRAMSGRAPPPISYAEPRASRYFDGIRLQQQKSRRDARIKELMSMPDSRMTPRDIEDLQMFGMSTAASGRSTRPLLAAAPRPLAPATAMPLAAAANPSGVMKATRGRGARGRARGSAATRAAPPQTQSVGVSASTLAAATTSSGPGDAGERGRGTARGRARGRGRGRPGRGM